MKLLLPIFNSLNIQSGLGIRSPHKLDRMRADPNLLICLWKDFSIVAQKSISFQKRDALRFFLNDHFSPQDIQSSTLATVEFDRTKTDAEDFNKFSSSAFEGQCIFRNPRTNNWVSLLYDFIPDKKNQHVYAPILHCAHSAHISENQDTYVVLANFRPPYLPSPHKTQKMTMQLKSSQGELLLERPLALSFNSAELISFRDEFSSFGGFTNGSSINFKGGESQFAIFTLFQNRLSGNIGIEHSLAPLYYCSGVRKPESRQIFYKNAFSDMGPST